MRIQKHFAGNNEPWRAEAALGSIIVNKSLLDWMQLSFCHQRFNRGDCLALCLNSEHENGLVDAQPT